ncbi:hypothetical protein BJV82DRAFT_717613 [Fennellomyces sp. T-0311]|nr:hypothetical protein BJV82DRAFT_717613 [Fennellomyces sp. T-0311]
MYVTYDTSQYPIFADGDVALYGNRRTPKLQALERSNERPPPGIRHLMTLSKKSSFRPTRLVRTSDMTVVPGTDAIGGYCAFSYSWNWSGDIVVRGKENNIRYDKCKHQIVYHNVDNTTDEDKERVESVKFEKVIQKICQDFGIQYIWYDQLCIKQAKREEKEREMRQMHQYYSNADYTIALVPEMKVIRKLPLTATASSYYPVGHHNIARCLRAIHESQWSTRALTYQEAMASSRILFVGENTHLWSDSVPHLYQSQFAVETAASKAAAYYVKTLCERPAHREASMILRHLHARRSTKEHDKLFAVQNIFPSVFADSPIDISYNEPITPLMISVYSKLAVHDLSMLCFGHASKKYHSTIQKYDLPSWTGVAGEHIYFRAPEGNSKKTKKQQTEPWPTRKDSSSTQIQKLIRKLVVSLAITKTSNVSSATNYTIHDGVMHMYCESIPIRVDKFDWEDTFGRFSTEQFIFSGDTAAPGTKGPSSTLWVDSRDYLLIREATGVKVTHIVGLKSLIPASDTASKKYNVSSICLSLTEECSECIILSGISFDLHHKRHYKAYPVVRQEDGISYRAIGLCFARTLKHYGAGIVRKQRFAIK